MEEVAKAADKIYKGDGSGIQEKLDANDGGWIDSKKVYTGSYQTIDKALKDFIEAANKNSEKQTQKAQDASTSTKQESYTGVATADAKKYITGGTKTSPNYGEVFTSSWVNDKYELNESDLYVFKGHKQVVRTKVSDEAIAAMCEVEFDATVAANNWHNTSLEAFGIWDRHTELTRGLIDWENMTD